MKIKSFNSSGTLHPILFFTVVYIVSLLGSIFICSSLFYSCNSQAADMTKKELSAPAIQEKPIAAVLYR